MELLNINPVYVIEEFGDIIKPICILVVLPITIIWLYLRNRKDENEKRTKIVMAAIAMAGYFAFVNQPLPFTIVVVVRHKGMQQNDCTSQRYQYFCRQLLHNE